MSYDDVNYRSYVCGIIDFLPLSSSLGGVNTFLHRVSLAVHFFWS